MHALSTLLKATERKMAIDPSLFTFEELHKIVTSK